MSRIFRNPSLPDYFEQGPVRDYVAEYEAAKVILLPNIADRIDVDFWGALDVDAYPALRKLRASINLEDPEDVSKIMVLLRKSELPEALREALASQIASLYKAVVPIYLAAFAGYNFSSTKAVFRLTTVMAENMHLDIYEQSPTDHLARLFINLDNQPRIWHTSWRANDLIEKYARNLDPELVETGSDNELWRSLTVRTFGKDSREWWDDEPRHIAFFDPGDCWLVDSRQVAHQIFYGRRALSIDFAVEKGSMRDPAAFYVDLAERARTVAREEGTGNAN